MISPLCEIYNHHHPRPGKKIPEFIENTYPKARLPFSIQRVCSINGHLLSTKRNGLCKYMFLHIPSSLKAQHITSLRVLPPWCSSDQTSQTRQPCRVPSITFSPVWDEGKVFPNSFRLQCLLFNSDFLWCPSEDTEVFVLFCFLINKRSPRGKIS